MVTPPVVEPRITYVDKLDGKLTIAFLDGRVALYSAALLSSVFDLAEPVEDLEEDWEEGEEE